MSDTSKKNIDLAKRFGDFKEALQEIAKRSKHKERTSEAMEYAKYYEDRIERVKRHNNILIQLTKVAIFHPKIIFKRFVALKNYVKIAKKK